MSIHYQPLKETIVSGEIALLKYAEAKGYLSMSRDGKKVTYTAQGLSYNFRDPEEHVRVELYVDLIDKYRYSASRIEFETPMPDSTPNRRADIVIYEDDDKKYPYIVIECKKDGISDAEFEQAVRQVIANARVLKAPYAFCVSGNTYRAIETEKWNMREPEK
ncbi:MAG TPA: type I restriction enzyme HsdR N-terminal domain-containing protein, partial [Patescibacteria group bacterium]|nr:type I restriction enzyme HsdR N-terminal domain-containing protein [Patescibacteria group bacterium]